MVTHRLATVLEMRDRLIAGIQRFPSLRDALAEWPPG
jgi:hypothetical protein